MYQVQQKLREKCTTQNQVKAHLNHTQKLKDLLTIFEKSFFLHRLARLLAPFLFKSN